MKRLIPFLFFTAAALVLPTSRVLAAEPAVVRNIVFPTAATSTLTDSYGDPRSGGRVHEGDDILGKKMMPLYAAVTGVVRSVTNPEESWGCRIVIQDADGYQYLYYHVNNDTPGTDDKIGCTPYSYAPGIARGTQVMAGQFIGWMGDSGNAEDVGAHLHFEIRLPVANDGGFGGYGEGESIDPYPSLVAAAYPGTFDKAAATKESPDINTDLNILAVSGATSACTSGSLIKSASSTAVYYCGANGKRYVFPNDRVYFTWYADFKTVKTITNAQLADIPLGGLVTYRPGIKMVKIESLPNVYAVTHGGVLRWIKSPEIATSLYGSTWKKQIDDISDAFFGSYKFGEDITAIKP
jgi:hypothetical protein